MQIDYLSASELISDSANSIHVVRMSSAFAELGHSVTLHALRGRGDSTVIHGHYGAAANFEIARYEHRPGMLARARRFGIPLGPAYRLASGYFAVRPRLCNDSLIVARNAEWLLACLNRRSRFIFETHSPPNAYYDRLIAGRILKHPGLKAFVVISRPLRDMWVAAHPHSAERIIVAPDGADPVPGLDPCAVVEADSSAPFRVGYVGHLYPGRGGELILEMARKIPEAEFHLVGGRPEDISRLHGLAPPPNIIFHGHKPPREIPDMMRCFDVVLAPYQTKVEIHGGGGNTVAWMSPLKIFEYMSYAKPILVSNLSVLKEALEPDHTAVFIKSDDASAWAAALRDLMSDPVKRQALGKRAHDAFLQRFTWSRRAARLLEAAGVTS